MNILVLGGSGGIGKEVVKKFIGEGNVIIYTYTSWSQELQDLNQYMINKLSCPIARHYVIGNPEDSDNYEPDIPLIGLDHAINCIGALHDRTLAKMSDEELYNNILINLNGSFEFCRKVIPHMREGGSITLISSVIANIGGFGQTNYSASKAGIEALTKSLAMELASHKIRVNCIRPSIVDTPIFSKFTAEQKQKLIDRTLLKRMATPKEIADLIYFVAVNGTYFDGDIIPISGGFT
jgi:NAD(P)-dependent dehydrogenase (short-subunit alcohol dehydrogenase family)